MYSHVTFSRMNYSLQGLVVLFSAVPIPGNDVPCQDTLDGAGIEILQCLRRYPECPQASEVKQSLPCLSHSCVVSKLDYGVVVESGYTVMCVQGVQQGANVKAEGGWGVSIHPHQLGSACQEVKDSLAQ